MLFIVTQTTTMLDWNEILPGHGNGMQCCYRHCYCYSRRSLQHKVQAVHWVFPQHSSALGKAGYPGAVVWGGGHEGQNGARCRDHAASRWPESSRPACSSNGSG